MEKMALITPVNAIAALLTLIPFLAVAFFPRSAAAACAHGHLGAIRLPGGLCIPYVLVACAAGLFRWGWLALYALLPAAVAILLRQATRADPEQRGNWRDFLVLATLGLAVDLRWFESAWPAHLAIFNKMLLLDAGIYGFVRYGNWTELDSTCACACAIRNRPAGGRLYTPIALALGLGLGFLHLHKSWPGFAPIAGAWIFTFFFIAVPEELFFRGWLQNLLERRMGRIPPFLTAACLDWRTSTSGRVLQLALRVAGCDGRHLLWPGLAADRRVGASAVTHASVDAIWSLWLR